MSSLKVEMAKGLMWTAIGKYTGIVISIVVSMVLARLIAPEEFGIVAIAQVAIAFIGVISDMGTGQPSYKINNWKKMTYIEFKDIEKKIIQLINNVLDTICKKNFSNYVLLLVHAGYQVELEHTFLSPYVINSSLEESQDRTRLKFLVNNINKIIDVMANHVSLNKDQKEFDVNIQMLIYTQIWESRWFLKTLKRISYLLIGKDYKWRIRFEDKNHKPSSKKNFIDGILNTNLQEISFGLYDLIRHSYVCGIRNSTAHSSYYIDVDSEIIALEDSETYSCKEKINFEEWDKIFIQSVMLSYHLMSILNTRLNHFMDDYPDIKTVSIKWPSYIHPGKYSYIKIYPYRIGKLVRFNFEKRSQPFLGKNDSK